MNSCHGPPTFTTLVRDFFCDRLVSQQNVSPHTVAAYCDAFRLLLAFLRRERRRDAGRLSLDDLDATTVLAFLDHLERTRGNTARTRNARLAAIRSFMGYASARDPTALPIAQQVSAIPDKRFDRPLLGHLTRDEIEAILAAPDVAVWSGRRDRALFTLMYNTGARVSEVISLCRGDIRQGPCASVRIHGKGRKERAVPLWKATTTLLAHWLAETAGGEQAPLFPNRFGKRLSRSGIEDRLDCSVSSARLRCPSLASKSVSPHMLRHTTAMHLLQAGVDLNVIALWLGHESPETTHQYVEADVEMKRCALSHLDAPPSPTRRRTKRDDLLEFLDRL
jgi:integrase/recombinase XerD